MEGMGERMRARARELGWSDAEVARRVGLAQTRYANYVTDRHEPDLATFLRICSVLGVPAGDLLMDRRSEDGPAAKLRRRVSAASEALDGETLAIAAVVLDALVARSASRAAERSPAPADGTTKPRGKAAGS